MTFQATQHSIWMGMVSRITIYITSHINQLLRVGIIPGKLRRKVNRGLTVLHFVLLQYLLLITNYSIPEVTIKVLDMKELVLKTR